jgi:hypothetical protein
VFFLQTGDLADLLCDSLRAVAGQQRALSAFDAQSLLEAALRGSAADLGLLEGSLTLDIQRGRSLGRAPSANAAKSGASGAVPTASSSSV